MTTTTTTTTTTRSSRFHFAHGFARGLRGEGEAGTYRDFFSEGLALAKDAVGADEGGPAAAGVGYDWAVSSVDDYTPLNIPLNYDV